MSDNQTTGRALLKFGVKEAAFGLLWALVILGIGNIALRYFNVFHAPEWEARFVWVVMTVAFVATVIGAMVIGPIRLVQHMPKGDGVANDR
ncbi:hypothetical protein HLH44_19930 [Gluconacetobacter sp. 1c LMG 22058]|uniref:Uncharacterized protein n=1 Tax=Gluconacetobacter dulcium TaxID=2729096 RepID=A0A7W4K3F4_9PROT|nr:hypothetical protein [Gluconacetobacter dulcium]MBB2199669.1 hypothetical protein [Gluconacetobacter dulcium]